MELENIYMLTVGQLRELLAYACAEESIDSWWEDITEEDLDAVGFYDDDEDEDDDYDGDSSYYDDNYDEDTDYDEDDELWDDEDEDEDYNDEDEEDDLDLDEDEVCEGEVLPDPVREQTAQCIAADIRAGLYNYNLVKSLYDEDILERIYQLI